MDIYSKSKRSAIMASISAKGTKPEMELIRLLKSSKYNILLNDKTLPGSPDIVIPRKRKVIFVNGCFWHGHNCKRSKLPRSNRSFWETKINSNKLRDRKNRKSLVGLSWQSIIVWECQLSTAKKRIMTLSRVKRFLSV